MPSLRGTTSSSPRARARTSSSVEQSSPPAQEVVRPAVRLSTHRAGILSRTLNPSSNSRLILTARIRSKRQNDVIFVGQTFIQLRELSESAQVLDPVARHDFGAQILATNIISSKLENIDFVDQVLDQAREEVRYTIRGKEIDQSQPPQILVLTTAANDMFYVYAKDEHDGSTRFVFAKRQFLSGVSFSETFGQRLAVDAESRALAVAPATSHCAIMSLKDLDEIKAEIDRWSPTSPKSFAPVKEQRFIQVDGYIQHMDFLRSSTHAPTKLILLLVVAGPAGTHILLYRWDINQRLTEIRPMRCSGQLLPIEDTFSCMLIPSSHSSAFTLVTEAAIVQYDNLISEQAKRVAFPLPYKPSRSDRTDERPRWTQWARLDRHALHRQSHDDLVLVREDGLLEVFLITYQPSLRVGGSFSPGSLNTSVDTAFCTIAAPRHMGGDLFIVGGDMCDGGVWYTRAREQVSRIQIIPNFAPAREMILLPTSMRKVTDVFANSRGIDRLFTATSGKSNRNRLSELRYALDAQVIWDLEYPDASSIANLWTLECKLKQKLLLVVSHATYTSILALDLQSQEMEAINEEILPGLDYDSVTLATAITPEEVVVQFTPNAIHLVGLGGTEGRNVIKHGYGKCLGVTIDGVSGFFAATYQSSSNSELRIGMLVKLEDGSFDAKFAPNRHEFSSQPVSISTSTLFGQRYVFVGTENGDIAITHANLEDGSLTSATHRSCELFDGLVEVPITSILSLEHPHATAATILCGTRNGYLLFLTLNGTGIAGNPCINVEAQGKCVLGSTAVTLLPDKTEDKTGVQSALCYNQSNLQRIKFYNNCTTVDYSIHSILLSRQEEVTYLQPSIHALHRIPKLNSVVGPPGGLLITATDTGLQLSNILSPERVVACHAQLQGIPRKMIYSSYLDRIIVGLDCLVQDNSSSTSGWPIADAFRPCLQLVNPNVENTETRGMSTSELLNVGEYGERIMSMMNWTPTDGHQHYEMIVAGLSFDEASKSSRLVYVSAKNLMRNSEARVKTIAKYPNKTIHSLATFLKSSLVVCVDTELCLITLDLATRKWLTVSRFNLPSPAKSLQTQGSYILVATSHHSVIVVRFDSKMNKFQFHGHDIRARNTSNCISYGNSSMILACTTNVNTSLIGYPDFRAKRLGLPQYEAKLPLMVDQIALLNATASREAIRHHFVGLSIDATMFHFITLDPNETKLLKFLENLVQPKKKNSKNVRMELRRLTRQYEDLGIGDTGADGGQVGDPADMYVKGDIIAPMLQPGPQHLSNLLARKIKVEDQDLDEMDTDNTDRGKEVLAEFEGFAQAVVGGCEDYADAVVAWVRRLMQAPICMTI